MLKRFNEINGFPYDDRNHIIFDIDTMLNKTKLKMITAIR